LLSGKSLPINFSSYATNVQTAGSIGKQTVNLSRALTRVKSDLFRCTKHPPPSTLKKKSICSIIKWHEHMRQQVNVNCQCKLVANSFRNIQFQALLNPFISCKNRVEFMVHTLHTIDIKGTYYINNKYVIGIDTEKVLGSLFAGYNAKSSDLITLAID
jgi:hypothetical protein